ncbi:hypothetical protein FWK35_00000312, partial [Aphis craccivora]
GPDIFLGPEGLGYPPPPILFEKNELGGPELSLRRENELFPKEFPPPPPLLLPPNELFPNPPKFPPLPEFGGPMSSILKLLPPEPGPPPTGPSINSSMYLCCMYVLSFDIALIASSLLPNSTFASPDGRLLLLKRMRISTGSNGSKNCSNIILICFKR